MFRCFYSFWFLLNVSSELAALTWVTYANYTHMSSAGLTTSAQRHRATDQDPTCWWTRIHQKDPPASTTWIHRIHHVDPVGFITWIHQNQSFGFTRIQQDPPRGSTRIHHVDPPGSIIWIHQDPSRESARIHHVDPPGSITWIH